MVAVVPELPGAAKRSLSGESRRSRLSALRSRPSRDFPVSALDPFSHTSVMALDVYRHADEWCIEVDVPGVDPSKIDVSYHDGVLTVRAIRARHHPGVATLEFAEREHGAFSRELRLSDELDPDKRRVACHCGVLTISVPFRTDVPAPRV